MNSWKPQERGGSTLLTINLQLIRMGFCSQLCHDYRGSYWTFGTTPTSCTTAGCAPAKRSFTLAFPSEVSNLTGNCTKHQELFALEANLWSTSKGKQLEILWAHGCVFFLGWTLQKWLLSFWFPFTNQKGSSRKDTPIQLSQQILWTNL